MFVNILLKTISRAVRARYEVLLIGYITKDAGDDSDDGYDDSGDDSSDSSDDGDDSDSRNSHYNPDEPRIPAGQPGGGQWTTEGNGTSSDSGSISADDIRSALAEGLENPSALRPSVDVAGG